LGFVVVFEVELYGGDLGEYYVLGFGVVGLCCDVVCLFG